MACGMETGEGGGNEERDEYVIIPAGAYLGEVTFFGAMTVGRDVVEAEPRVFIDVVSRELDELAENLFRYLKGMDEKDGWPEPTNISWTPTPSDAFCPDEPKAQEGKGRYFQPYHAEWVETDGAIWSRVEAAPQLIARFQIDGILQAEPSRWAITRRNVRTLLGENIIGVLYGLRQFRRRVA